MDEQGGLRHAPDGRFRAALMSHGQVSERVPMEKAAFFSAFDRAATFCRAFGQRFVVEELPPELRFDFRSSRRAPDANGRIKFLGGRLLEAQQLCGVEFWQARKYLWVDGKIPCWIDLQVRDVDAGHSYILVTVSYRLTADDTLLYHQWEGNPPFHVLGPALPPGWISLKHTGRFSLHWRPPDQRW